MSDDATPSFAAAIHDHLELRRRNASLEFEMPLANYLGSAADIRRNVEDRVGFDDEEDTIANVVSPK
jgi:hypothetical protein